jgi:hypothetical protein
VHVIGARALRFCSALAWLFASLPHFGRENGSVNGTMLGFVCSLAHPFGTKSASGYIELIF